MISQIPKTCFIWLFAAFRWSGNTTIESWSKVSPHQSNHDVRSEFPIKDNFSTGIQTIRKCTRQERQPVPQYDNQKQSYPDNWWTSSDVYEKRWHTEITNSTYLCEFQKKIQQVIYGINFSSFSVSDCVHTFKVLFQEIEDSCNIAVRVLRKANYVDANKLFKDHKYKTNYYTIKWIK